jgi:FtsP/CotA-like multicopper oxidase with cupredoxin domain
MRTRTRTTLLAALALTAVPLVTLIPGASSGAAPAGARSPVTTAARAATPAPAQPTVVPDPTGAVHLCARTGSATMPDGLSVPIWGFAVGDCTDPAVPATLPGPVVELTAGAAARIEVHNTLPTPVSLVIPGVSAASPPAAPGGSVTVPLAPAAGTYLYESASDPARSVPMGLYGALVVRPAGAPEQAYAGTATGFDTEAVLVLSEVDPALHANPSTFVPRTYRPVYWLVNGRGHPQTAPVPAAAGQRVLLRYANAGQQHHTMTLLGAHQRVIGADAVAARHPYDAVAVPVVTGATVDALVTVPAGAAGGSLPLYSRSLRLTNGATATSPGGMQTAITVAAGP